MIKVRTQLLTPSQARVLVHMGFILDLVEFCGRDHDRYVVYVRA